MREWRSGERNLAAIGRKVGVGRSTVQGCLSALRVRGEIKSETPSRPGAPPVEEVEPTDDISTRLLRAIQVKKDGVTTVESLCDRLDVSPRRLRETLGELEKAGYNIYVDDDVVSLTRQEEGEVMSSAIEGGLRFGVISDTHLGCKAERLDVLDSLYDWYAEEGITTVYHAGNMIEGESRFNVRDRHKHGMDAQVNYFLERYPSRPGIITKYVTGDDHEGWYQQREGISIGRYIQARAIEEGREDLQYLGFMEHDIEVKNAAGSFMMRVAHPGGGSAYAISYTPQKIVESLSGGEKPALLIIGHYHKMEYLYTRGVRVVQAGCTVDQGVWARKKRLAYHLGGWVLDLQQCPKTGALVGCKLEDRTYFDRQFYRDWEADATGSSS